jgi:perosamine synthetase
VLLGLGIGPGDEVVLPSHSFIATANAVTHCGAQPVFADIEPATYNLDPASAAAAITPRTRALLVVHQMGLPCRLEALGAIAERHGLPMVEDAACALGSEVQREDGWEPIGRPHGIAACFSFHPRKIVTTGEGGMITTRDPALAARLRLLRQHGMSIPAEVRHGASAVSFEEYPEIGYNFRMTDLQAAVGRVQLRRLPGLLHVRRSLAAAYTEALAAIPGLVPPSTPEGVRPNHQSFPVRVTSAYPLSRDELMRQLLAAGIHTRRGIMNAHQEAAYAAIRRPGLRLPHSEAARDGVLLLPLHADMSSEDLAYVIDHLRRLSAGNAAAP